MSEVESPPAVPCASFFVEVYFPSVLRRRVTLLPPPFLETALGVFPGFTRALLLLLCPLAPGGSFEIGGQFRLGAMQVTELPRLTKGRRKNVRPSDLFPALAVRRSQQVLAARLRELRPPLYRTQDRFFRARCARHGRDRASERAGRKDALRRKEEEERKRERGSERGALRHFAASAVACAQSFLFAAAAQSVL